MREIVCVRCHKRLLVKDLQADPNRVWVKCPSCGEVFKIQPLDVDDLLDVKGSNSSNSPGFSSPSHAPSLASQSAIHDLATSYAQWKGGPREDEFLSVVEFPATPPKKDFSRLLKPAYFVVLVGAVIAAISFIYGGSAPPAAEPPPPKAAAPASAAYPPSFLASDLKAIKATLKKTQTADQVIAYKGDESRVYQYFNQALGDKFCPDISSLRLYSSDTSRGFTIKGVCFDEKLTPVELKVEWVGADLARVKAVGEPLFREISLLTGEGTDSPVAPLNPTNQTENAEN